MPKYLILDDKIDVLQTLCSAVSASEATVIYLGESSYGTDPLTTVINVVVSSSETDSDKVRDAIIEAVKLLVKQNDTGTSILASDSIPVFELLQNNKDVQLHILGAVSVCISDYDLGPPFTGEKILEGLPCPARVLITGHSTRLRDGDKDKWPWITINKTETAILPEVIKKQLQYGANGMFMRRLIYEPGILNALAHPGDLQHKPDWYQIVASAINLLEDQVFMHCARLLDDDARKIIISRLEMLKAHSASLADSDKQNYQRGNWESFLNRYFGGGNLSDVITYDIPLKDLFYVDCYRVKTCCEAHNVEWTNRTPTTTAALRGERMFGFLPHLKRLCEKVSEVDSPRCTWLPADRTGRRKRIMFSFVAPADSDVLIGRVVAGESTGTFVDLLSNLARYNDVLLLLNQSKGLRCVKLGAGAGKSDIEINFRGVPYGATDNAEISPIEGSMNILVQDRPL